MQSRIEALYNSKLLSRFLLAVFIGEIIGLVTLGFLALHGMEGEFNHFRFRLQPQTLCPVTSEPFPGIHQCTCTKFPSYTFMFWVPILFFDTLLFFLALGLIFASWRQRPQEPTPRRCGPSIVNILLRDNFGYFFL